MLHELILTRSHPFLGRKIRLRALSEARVYGGAQCRQAPAEAAMKERPAGNPLLSAEPDRWPGIAPRRAVFCAGVLFERNRSDYFRTNVDWTLATQRPYLRNAAQ